MIWNRNGVRIIRMFILVMGAITAYKTPAIGDN